LIDPASDRARLMELRDGPGVREVWLTHWHEDHIMHLDLFDDVPLTIPFYETAPLSDLEIFLDWYGLDDPVRRQGWKDLLQAQFHFRPRTPARTFRGGEVIAAAGTTVEVLHTPGHTPGHLAYYFREAGVLFMGDYDLTKFGPWYGDVGSSIEETISSVERLRTVRARTWLTAHEDGVFVAEPGEVWDRYVGVIGEREDKLLAYLTEPRTMEEIAGQWIVYGRPREPKDFFEFSERALMGKHLERLERQGIVVREGERYKRK
jgi:hydroxyacylglutathione hydrolase